jgi:SnoaL-like domain
MTSQVMDARQAAAHTGLPLTDLEPPVDDITRLIDDYLDAYGEPDKARRSAAVTRLWAEDAQLIDPPLAARGHAQIVAQADQLLAQFPQHRFRRSSGIDAHHGLARYAWQLLDPIGQVVLEGCDFAEIDEAGRLAKVAGFIGPLPVHETVA